MMSESKARQGRFFEDFTIGAVMRHAVPRTVTTGDAAVYQGLFGSRFPLHCAAPFAKGLGYPDAPLDDLLTFHIIFGKSVPDISLNAVANLGYAGGRFLKPVFPGDTLRAESDVIGKREVSAGDSGAVYVKTTGYRGEDEKILEFYRWVLVKKRDKSAPAPEAVIPDLPAQVDNPLSAYEACLTFSDYDSRATGEKFAFEDYAEGEVIDHINGVTVEEADHMAATRLYHNTAKLHFNAHTEKDGRFGGRLIYGGHVISLARALSFNGLANGFKIAAINGGKHVAPVLAGATLYARSEILGRIEVGSDKIGALRVRLLAFKDCRATIDTPANRDGKPHPGLVLDFDYTLLIPKRAIL